MEVMQYLAAGGIGAFLAIIGIIVALRAAVRPENKPRYHIKS